MNILFMTIIFNGFVSNSEPLKTYSFDFDGGSCNHQVNAKFGYKGKVIIEGGNNFMGNGGFIRDYVNLENGLVIYAVSPFDAPSNFLYFYTLNPQTGDIGAFQTDVPEELKDEGMVDTMQLTPCE